jgi:glutaredoxin
MAKEFFKEQGATYEEHDVAADLAARKEMFDKSHQMGVPVIVVDEQVIVGFDKEALKKAIAAK